MEFHSTAETGWLRSGCATRFFEEPGAGSYRLLFGRAPMQIFSHTQANAPLMDLMDENAVWLSDVEKVRLGSKSSDYGRLRNHQDMLSEKTRDFALAEECANTDRPKKEWAAPDEPPTII
jgi:hypothetical protein